MTIGEARERLERARENLYADQLASIVPRARLSVLELFVRRAERDLREAEDEAATA